MMENGEVEAQVSRGPYVVAEGIDISLSQQDLASKRAALEERYVRALEARIAQLEALVQSPPPVNIPYSWQ